MDTTAATTTRSATVFCQGVFTDGTTPACVNPIGGTTTPATSTYCEKFDAGTLAPYCNYMQTTAARFPYTGSTPACKRGTTAAAAGEPRGVGVQMRALDIRWLHRLGQPH